MRPREAQEGEVPLSRLVSQGALFTHLDPAPAAEGPPPGTNNAIEGGVNARLREMPGSRRGMSRMRRAKAVFWWCRLHTEEPKRAREILSSMPADDDIDLLHGTCSAGPKRGDGGPEWGDRAVWEELHHRDPRPFWLDSSPCSIGTHFLSYKPHIVRDATQGRSRRG